MEVCLNNWGMKGVLSITADELHQMMLEFNTLEEGCYHGIALS